MKGYLLRITALLILVSSVGATQQPSPEPNTIPASIDYIFGDVQQQFISLAEVMPEEKWDFKPTQGEFDNARTFREQVKHVACANEAWAKQIAGEEPPERCDLGGPSPAKTKAEILKYLRDSFSLLDKAVAATNANNLLHPNSGPYWGPNRLAALTAAIWHVSDHYGQLVEYLRMNGIVPPASR